MFLLLVRMISTFFLSLPSAIPANIPLAQQKKTENGEKNDLIMTIIIFV